MEMNCQAAECDEEEEIKIVEAIEAAYEVSLTGKRERTTPIHDLTSNQDRPKSRRRLPSSFFASPFSRSFSPSPCQAANSEMKYPALRFGGKISYSRTSTEVEKAAMELLCVLKANERETSQPTVGFDIEWKPTFRKGVSAGKAAVMQICGDTDHCYVMHIVHSGIPPSLQLLLGDSAVLKVGVGIGNDARKVYKDHNVSIKAVEDISYLAKEKLSEDSQNWSLQSLTKRLVCKELEKPNKIRLGNWEAKFLSQDQLQYAATDAFASWHLYQVLKSLPEPVKETADRTI